MAKRGGARQVGVSWRFHKTPGIFINSLVPVADNSGAKLVRVIGVIGHTAKPVHREIPGASVGDMVVVSVVEGKPEVRKQILRAIVIRQRRPYRRPDGTWIAFEDNAVVITDENGAPKGSEIHGPVAMEAALRWPGISNLATIII
ncbi:50S ribosomal protein L14 [Vulcanisaeta sp. JCM 16161]|uniref:50S ribosomal protein L14 n=1 Tax=Vulcanisaeta sp. JCM 16161 TaxID=1295372 RepID=UPI00406D14F8